MVIDVDKSIGQVDRVARSILTLWENGDSQDFKGMTIEEIAAELITVSSEVEPGTSEEIQEAGGHDAVLDRIVSILCNEWVWLREEDEEIKDEDEEEEEEEICGK